MKQSLPLFKKPCYLQLLAAFHNGDDSRKKLLQPESNAVK